MRKPIRAFVNGVEVFPAGLSAAWPLQYIDVQSLDDLADREKCAGQYAHMLWFTWPDNWPRWTLFGAAGTMNTIETLLPDGTLLIAFGVSDSYTDDEGRLQPALRVVQVMKDRK